MVKSCKKIHLIIRSFILVGIFLISYSSISAQNITDNKDNHTMELKYIDGSGNVYIIKKDSIEYIPITKENSSSSVYSGGTHQKKSIEEDQFKQITDTFDSIFKNKTIHIKNRIMTSGKLIIIENGTVIKSVIIKKSKESEELEYILLNSLNN